VPPWLVLALLIALIAALLYQLVRTRSLRRVPFYWVFTLVGFLAAQAGVESANISSPQIGELQIIPDLIGALIAIAILWLLGL
jgi:uncharacterized membrane protein YeaQ/YmgE (transglycosylase-associated protein family)